MKSKLIIFLAFIGLISSCKKNSDTPPEPQKTRTVLVYIIANNNLSDYGLQDINEMESAWKDSYRGNLIVFYNDDSGTNRLFKISNDNDPQKINSEVVKWYPLDSKVCTKEFLQEVINDVMDMFPADSYALDLWSHGSGWIPNGERYPLSVIDRYSKYFTLTDQAVKKEKVSSFGIDYKHFAAFEAYTLAEALSPYKFDFILFDACHMASIECEYQMRNCCKYYIASAAETLVDGAPYDQITSDMFEQPNANVISIGEKFFKYYENKSATISVVDCSKLENLATELNKIVTIDPQVPFSSIQQYGRDATGYINCMYDLEDFVQQTWGEAKADAFSKALSEAVIYKAATNKIMDEIKINHHCGLSCYIPVTEQKNCLNIYRTYYTWAASSGLGKMVN